MKTQLVIKKLENLAASEPIIGMCAKGDAAVLAAVFNNIPAVYLRNNGVGQTVQAGPQTVFLSFPNTAVRDRFQSLVGDNYHWLTKVFEEAQTWTANGIEHREIGNVALALVDMLEPAAVNAKPETIPGKARQRQKLLPKKLVDTMASPSGDISKSAAIKLIAQQWGCSTKTLWNDLHHIKCNTRNKPQI